MLYQVIYNLSVIVKFYIVANTHAYYQVRIIYKYIIKGLHN